jgi:hypothetical protein
MTGAAGTAGAHSPQPGAAKPPQELQEELQQEDSQVLPQLPPRRRCKPLASLKAGARRIAPTELSAREANKKLRFIQESPVECVPVDRPERPVRWISFPLPTLDYRPTKDIYFRYTATIFQNAESNKNPYFYRLPNTIWLTQTSKSQQSTWFYSVRTGKAR